MHPSTPRRGQSVKQKRWQRGSKSLYDDSIDTQDSCKYRALSSEMLDSATTGEAVGTSDDCLEEGARAESPPSSAMKSPLLGDTTRCLPYDCDTTIDDSVHLIDFSADDKLDEEYRSMSIGDIPTLPRRTASRASLLSSRSSSRKSLVSTPKQRPSSVKSTHTEDASCQVSDVDLPAPEPLRSSSRVSDQAAQSDFPSPAEPSSSFKDDDSELPPPPPPLTQRPERVEEEDTSQEPPAYSLSDAKSTDV